MRFLRGVLLGLLMLSVYAGAAEKDRPIIGLVLSGGGARGGAHVGVLKVLEAHRIPVDAIVGTSMGSLVGGLYAAGYRADEIEQILTGTDWTEYIAFDYDRTKMPFRRKELQRAFPGNLKVGIDINHELTLSSGLFKQQPMLQFLESKLRHVPDGSDFDALPIPFRSIATDFSNGETVVLRRGSLARSIYASLSIPGGFFPIEIDGKILVDGGVADNLPLDVMRNEMDADIIFVVDVSMPFEDLPEYQSFLGIVNQLSNILVRKNTDRALGTLKENEILVVPDLEGYTSLDADRYPQIIVRGERAMTLFGSDAMPSLAQDAEAYREYRMRFDGVRTITPPVIDRIELRNPTYIDDRTILGRLHVRTGEPLDYNRLHEDIDTIYNMTLFDEVDYTVENVNGENVLIIRLTPSSDINGKLKFAFGFEDDFNGHSDYFVKFEYLMMGLNRFGGEWRNRMEIGIEKLLYSEWYQPLEPMQRFYIRPALFYRDKKLYVSPGVLGSHFVESDLDDSVPIRAKEYGGEMSFGINIGTSVQIESGVVSKKVEPEIALFYVDYNGTYYKTLSASQDVTYAYALLQVDTMDKAFFPTKGLYFDLEYSRQLPQWGSEVDYSQLYGTLSSVVSFGRHSLIGRLRGGTTFDAANFAYSEDFGAIFTLGGLFNLSGLPTNAVTGDDMLFGMAGYRYALSKKGFFGSLEMPTYVGFTVETGDAWYEEYGEKIQLRGAGSVYVSVDTFLGPFYLGFGMAEGGYSNLYLSLGESF